MKKQLLNLLLFLLPLVSTAQTGGFLNLIDMENPPYTYQRTKFFLRASAGLQTPVIEYYGLDAVRLYMDSAIFTKLYALTDASPSKLVTVNSSGLLRSFTPDYLKAVDTTGKWLPVGTIIPNSQVQSDWNQASSGATDFIKNKPRLGTPYLGTTDGSGNYTVTYDTAYSVTPDVQPQIQNATVTQNVRITATSTTGFTVQVTNRAIVSLLGIDLVAGTATPVSGASVGVLVTAR